MCRSEDEPGLLHQFRQFLRKAGQITICTAESARTSAVSGVSSDGFITMVQPVASAGATFHALRTAAVTLSAAHDDAHTF
jgi:hypothetical protein